MRFLTFFMILHAVVAARMLDPDENDTLTDRCYDGSMCYNGSVCIPFEEGYKSPQKGRTTRCDCTTTLTYGVEFYAGYGCEYDANDYCIHGPANTGGISFCVNQGKCKEIWRPKDGEVAFHKGCNCVAGWEGPHCEYKVGEAPYIPKTASATLVAFGITTPIMALTVGGFLYWRRKNGKEQSRSPVAPNSPLGQPNDFTAGNPDII